MRIVITPGDDLLRQFDNQLKALSEGKARVGMARAVNRVTRSVYGKVIRAVARQSSIPLRIVKQQTRMRLAAHQGTGPIQGEIIATGKPISLREFGARQFSFGVRAKVWGEFRKFESAFIYAGTYKSGNPVANGHVFLRVGKKRLPIEKQFGPNVPDELVVGESAVTFTKTAEAMLPARVSHELSRLLGI